MDRRLFGTQRVPSAMEIEHSRQNSSSNLPQPREPNSRFSELQLRRDRRRTSENKFADIRNPQPEQKLCDFCRQLILLSIYDQHIIDCPQKPANQHTMHIIDEVEGRQDPQEQRQSNTMETEENQLQLARPLQDPPMNPSGQAPENLFNLFGRFRNPLTTFPRPEPQESEQPQAPTNTTSSFLSSIFNSIFNPLRQHQRADNLPIEPEQNPTHAPVEGQNQPDNEGGLFSGGALFVRTIQPGPNGTVIVRMRVIPLGNLFGNQEENAEGNAPPNDGLVGGLLSMLLGLHGHGLFQEERGLEKEALESLPVVSYHNETFKHVDDEYKSCPICLDQFEEEQEVRFLWCLHRFHKNCVDQWLDKHTTCPICKKDYSEAVKNCEEVCEESS